MPVLRRLLVVVALAVVGLVPTSADAAGYCSGSGVNVVVDFGALGGGIVKDCDSSGNRNAAKAFEDTGHHLSYAQRQPGFVCRVDGVPTTDPCFNTSPADAYWGLYWSDGTSGWKYSSVAVGSLTVPAGATVAFSWQNGGDADLPGTAPASPAVSQPATTASSPRPTRTPTTTSRPRATVHVPTATPSAGSAVVSPTGKVSATPTATGSATPSAAAATTPVEPSASASASTTVASAGTSARLDSSADSGGGLPWWVPAGAILVLAGAGGAVWRVRRARS